MWKLTTTKISNRKRTLRKHRPRVKQRVQPHTGYKVHRTCSQIFGVVYGAKRQRAINSGKSVMHDGHRQPFLELLSSKRFVNKQRRRIQIVLPFVELLSSREALPPSSGEGLSSASSPSETDGDDSTDALGLAVPPDGLTPADVAGGVDIEKSSGVPALLCTGVPRISLMAELLNEVSAAVPRPPTGEALVPETAACRSRRN